MQFLAIDPALATGYAFLNGKNIVVKEFSGTPLVQYQALEFLIKTYFLEKPMIAFEQLNFFRNAQTVRSLSQRVGYLNWRAIEDGYVTSFVNASTVRKFLGCKTKNEVYDLFFAISNDKTKLELTYNMTDAAAILAYVNGLTPDKLKDFTVGL